MTSWYVAKTYHPSQVLPSGLFFDSPQSYETYQMKKLLLASVLMIERKSQGSKSVKSFVSCISPQQASEIFYKVVQKLRTVQE